MLLNIAFAILMGIACVPPLVWGGWEGRETCIMFVIAALATYFGATTLKNLVSLPNATIMVDLMLLAGLAHVAARTDRYWPLWICAFHMLSVFSFLAWQFVPTSPRLFKAISAVWSIPELVVLSIGPILDMRHASAQELSHAKRPRTGE